MKAKARCYELVAIECGLWLAGKLGGEKSVEALVRCGGAGWQLLQTTSDLRENIIGVAAD
jgi:hypothetical protein